MGWVFQCSKRVCHKPVFGSWLVCLHHSCPNLNSSTLCVWGMLQKSQSVQAARTISTVMFGSQDYACQKATNTQIHHMNQVLSRSPFCDSSPRVPQVLMLGKNQIHRIENLNTLEKLDVLDLHSNRIKEIQNVSHLKHLRPLHAMWGCFAPFWRVLPCARPNAFFASRPRLTLSSESKCHIHHG